MSAATSKVAAASSGHGSRVAQPVRITVPCLGA